MVSEAKPIGAAAYRWAIIFVWVAAALEARSDCLNGRAKTPAFVARVPPVLSGRDQASRLLEKTKRAPLGGAPMPASLRRHYGNFTVAPTDGGIREQCRSRTPVGRISMGGRNLDWNCPKG
jgi:hypothetical protein